MLATTAPRLTKRQAQIADLLASGAASREIAAELHVSPRTVETHIAALFNKLGVRSRAEFFVMFFGPISGLRGSAESIPPLQSRSNLPAARSNLVGRGREIADTTSLLGQSRLVTLTGVGGIGKTRVALAVGETVLPQTKAGVWIVELAQLATGTAIAQALANDLHIEETADVPLIETLISRFEHQAPLLILDNCEHVIDDAAVFIDTLLARCPHLRILATSREPLRIAGEQLYRLPSLPVPTQSQVLQMCTRDATTYAAIALFAERARAVDRDFALRDDNVAIVAQICRQLDGIPLALELAAARVKSLSVYGLATKLDTQLRILTGGERTVAPRQQTMHALITWSYDLLSEPERRLFETLSVFVGGGTFSEVFAVSAEPASDEADVLLVLSSLVDKSLVVADVRSRDPRYSLLQTSRHYASEKLAARGLLARATARHASAYLDLAQRLEHAYDEAPDSAWFDRAHVELENWRAALHWSLALRHDLELGLRLTSALRPVWAIGDGWRRWLALARAAVDDRCPRVIVAQLDFTAAWLAFVSGEYTTTIAISASLESVLHEIGDVFRSAYLKGLTGSSFVSLENVTDGTPLIEDALVVARALEKRPLIAALLQSLAKARLIQNDLIGGRALLTESLTLYEDMGAQRHVTSVLNVLAEAEFRAGNSGEAVRLVTKCVQTLRMFSYALFVVRRLNNLAAYCIDLNRFEEACAHAHEALDIACGLESSLGVPSALSHLAAIAALRPVTGPIASATLGDAARVFGYSDATMAALGGQRDYAEERQFKRVMAVLEADLGTDRLAALLLEGAAMPLGAARAAVFSLVPFG